MKWDDMKVGNLVKDCNPTRSVKRGIGIIIKEHECVYMTSDSLTEYHNVKYRYDVLWQATGTLEEDIEEHDIELYEEWLAARTGEEILTAAEKKLNLTRGSADDK